MHLYIVTRWGNDDSTDGPNGDNTVFLVRANSHLSAVALVNEVLCGLPHERVQPYAHMCHQIGIDRSTSMEEQILLGPIIQNFYSSDYLTGWVLHDDLGLDWQTFKEVQQLFNRKED